MPIPIALICHSLYGGPQTAYTPRVDLEEGRFLKTLADAEAQIKSNPANALAWAAKAHALTSFFRFTEALDCANRSLALNPNLAEGYLARGLARGGAAIQQRNFGSIGKASGALKDLRRATELDPKLPLAWISLGLAYQELPGILGGSTMRALGCAESLKRFRPTWGNALQGMVLSLEKRWFDAEPCFRRALELGAQEPYVVNAYLESLGSRETRKVLGEDLQKAQLAKAARTLNQGIRRRALGVEAICDALLQAGFAEEAWKAGLDALPHVDAPSLVKGGLGKISAKGGIHREEGLAFLDQALRGPLEGGSSGPASLWWRKAQILKELGRVQEAKNAALEALKVDPYHPGAGRLLAELR